MGILPDIPETTEHYDRVCTFMRKAGQHLPAFPTLPDAETRILRAKLILEEALETIRALGVGLVVPVSYNNLTPEIQDKLDAPGVDETKIVGYVFESEIDVAEFEEAYEANLVGIVDGCADLSVVTTGTLIACGVADANVLKLVDKNNLAKFGPGCTIRPDGKVIKPPGHVPPDFEAELKRQEEL